jgi:hypothetical protein
MIFGGDFTNLFFFLDSDPSDLFLAVILRIFFCLTVILRIFLTAILLIFLKYLTSISSGWDKLPSFALASCRHQKF